MPVIKKGNCYMAPSADIIGDVTLAEDVNVWYHATIRADADKVYIGKKSNIQDNCVIHVDEGYPVRIGDKVTVGHGAIIHGCEIGDCSLIGMGAILLNGCKIGKNCLIGAGALVTGGVDVPDGSVVLGNPGKVVRKIRDEELEANVKNAEEYVSEAKERFGVESQP
jgi:carbonic anhydrase/acetyltransferase-like protein (isoleucine patch superfamily)